MNAMTLTDAAILIGFATQLGAIVWGAATISSGLKTVTDLARETKQDLKDHTEQDREFQLNVIGQLGSIAPTIHRPNGGQRS